MSTSDVRPEGLFTQLLRFTLVLLFLFVFLYGLLCAVWTFDEPLRLDGAPLTTALHWHIAPVKLWLSGRFSLADLIPAFQAMYAQQFSSFRWFAGVAAAAALAILGAFHFDHLAISRRGHEATFMTRRHINLACLAYFGVFLLCLAISALLGPKAGLPMRMLTQLLLLLAMILTPVVWLIRRFIKPSRPGAGLSDVRDIAKQLRTGTDFPPEGYFDTQKGCFLGLDADRKAVYIPWRTLRTTHTQVLGMTGTGKGVASAVVLAQCARAGESVIVFDPKDDSFMPGVLDRAAREAGVPFTLIDLRPGRPPQVNPFQGATVDEAYDLMVAAFNLREQGNNADIYKLEEKLCAQEVAQLARNVISLPTIVQTFEPRMFDAREGNKKNEVKGRKFWLDLMTLWTLTPIQTSAGPDLRACVEKPGILYIVGSLTDPRVIQAQKMLLYRIMQLIVDRDRAKDHYACVMLDELKYLLSPQVLTMLSTVRDRKCHMLLAHQSLGDLRDSIELDGKAVTGAVIENTGLKLIYRVNSPETAKWASDLSGKITAYTSTQGMERHLLEHPGAWKETQRNLIEENVLLQLPKGVGIIYGIEGPARLVHISPLHTGSNPGYTQKFPLEMPASAFNVEAPTVHPEIVKRLLNDKELAAECGMTDADLRKLAAAAGTSNPPAAAEPAVQRQETRREQEGDLL